MREVQLKDAKAKLSAIVDEVGRGEEIAITRHGRKEAVLLSWDGWEKLANIPTFARLLMASPSEEGDLEPLERSTVGDVDL